MAKRKRAKRRPLLGRNLTPTELRKRITPHEITYESEATDWISSDDWPPQDWASRRWPKDHSKEAVVDWIDWVQKEVKAHASYPPAARIVRQNAVDDAKRLLADLTAKEETMSARDRKRLEGSLAAIKEFLDSETQEVGTGTSTLPASQCQVEEAGSDADQTQRKRRKRGRPAHTDPKADQNIYDGWRTGQHENYADLARNFGISKHEAKKVIDRHRKRIERKQD